MQSAESAFFRVQTMILQKITVCTIRHKTVCFALNTPVKP